MEKLCIVSGKPLNEPSKAFPEMDNATVELYNIKKLDSKKVNVSAAYFFVSSAKCNERICCVIDLDDDSSCASVTNRIDEVADFLGVSRMIYRDSDGVYDYWSKVENFKSLALVENGAVIISSTFIDALNIALKRQFYKNRNI